MIKVIKKSRYLFLFCLMMISSQTFGQGSRYTGTYKKSATIEYVNKNTIVIEGLEINAENTYCIDLRGCENVIIRNCKFTSAPNKRAVYLYKCKNVTITDCYFENVYEGVQASLCENNIKIEHNDFKNIRGQLDGGSYFADAIQFNSVSGPGNSISYNAIENIQGESSPEDVINLYASNGTPNSPIIVKNNWLRGGGPNPSGGGILLGDKGGSYQIAEGNILVNPGQYGMGIAGGHNITLRNNKIYAKRQPFTNVGLSICNWSENKPNGDSYNITVENNEVNWTHRDGYLNNAWTHKNMGHLKGKETNKYNPNLNESILPENILHRSRTSDSSKPEEEEEQPDLTTSNITQVYTDSFNRIAIKYFTSPIPRAYGELFTSSGQRIDALDLPRFNTVFPLRLPKGKYYVRVTYRDLGITEINEISVN